MDRSADGHQQDARSNGKRIFELRVTAKQWTVDHGGQVRIMRYGFPIVPDFGGTAHAYCAEIGDLLARDHKPRRDDALRGYITRSRVSDASNLLLAQPYNPHLFRQGVFPGPGLLLQVLQKEFQRQDIKAAWKAAEKVERPNKTDGEKWP